MNDDGYIHLRKQSIKDARKRGRTYEEIGKLFGVSRQRVHQICNDKPRSGKSRIKPKK